MPEGANDHRNDEQDFADQPTESLHWTEGTVADLSIKLPEGYEFVEKVGEGGFGYVLKARQKKPARVVAIKIMKMRARELDEEDERIAVEKKRFLREADAVATLKHPGIVPIYEFGEVEGRYYFSMEFVEGVPLDRYVLEQKLTLKEKLQLFQRICEIVTHAHMRGVTHRDLKPDNILMDKDGNPRVLDFGLAKITETETGEQLSQMTVDGQVMGTLAYMSPEQAEGRTDEIDTRTDVYSLGVILYQMLTGEMPYRVDLPSPMAVLRNVCRAEPKKPSLNCGELKGDIETILLKTLEKDISRRYQSPGDIARDFEHYLNDEPIEARPPSALYRLQKTVRRHRAAATMVLSILVVIAVAFCWVKSARTKAEKKSQTAEEQRLAALDAKQHEESKRQLAEEARRRAEQERDQAEKAVKTEAELRKVAEQERERARRESYYTKLEPTNFNLSIEKWIDAQGYIGGIALSPDASRVYVAYWGREDGAPIVEYSVESGERLRIFPFSKHHCHGDVVVSKDGRFLYTPNYYFTFASRLDLTEGGRESTADIGGVKSAVWAADIDAAPSGDFATVMLGRDGRNYDMKNDQISIIDTSGGAFQLVGEVRLPDEPSGHKMGFSHDPRFGYVVTRPRQSPSATLYEICLQEPFEITRSLPFRDGDLTGVVVHGASRKIFVSDSTNKKIWVVDQDSFTIQASIGLDGAAPGTLAVSPVDDVLYALSPGIRCLWAINPVSNRAIGRLKGLRKNPTDIEISPDGSHVFVSHRTEEGGVCVLNVQGEPIPALNKAGTGEIVFASDRAANYQIYKMDIDGDNLVRLTSNNATEQAPRWSPDGRRIAFISDRGGPPKVYVMSENGKDVSCLNDSDPTFGQIDMGVPLDWSSDGLRIVFINATHTAIRMIGADGKDLKTIVEGQIAKRYSYYQSVSWKWGDEIVFAAQSPDSGYCQNVFAVRPDTGRVTQITKGYGRFAYSLGPAVSPGGDRIAVGRPVQRNASRMDVFVMGMLGGGSANLTKSSRVDILPRWSPDAKRIVFCSGTSERKHIWVMDADGTKQEQLTMGRADDTQPDIRRPTEPQRQQR